MVMSLTLATLKHTSNERLGVQDATLVFRVLGDRDHLLCTKSWFRCRVCLLSTLARRLLHSKVADYRSFARQLPGRGRGQELRCGAAQRGPLQTPRQRAPPSLHHLWGVRRIPGRQMDPIRHSHGQTWMGRKDEVAALWKEMRYLLVLAKDLRTKVQGE